MAPITLAQLRTFLAIVDAGTFGEAALVMNLSQSTVSAAIADLERSLDAKVFERGRHGAVLTPLGARLVEHARTALASVDAMHQEARASRGTLAGELRIATLRSTGTHLLPPILAAFHARYPDVRVRVLNETRAGESIEQTLHEGRADVSLLSLPVRTSLLTWELARDEYVALFPATAAPSALTWDMLEGSAQLLSHEECARLVRSHAREHGRILPDVNQVNEDSVILSLVAHGLGISVLPLLAVHPLPANVVAYSLPDPCWRSLAVAALPQRASAPLVRAFVETARLVWPTPAVWNVARPVPGEAGGAAPARPAS